MKKTNAARRTILTCLFLVLIAAPAALFAEETLKIGILAPFDFPTGQGLRWAAEMAADEINDQGGILGKRIELKYADTKSRTEIGAYGYVKLVRDEGVAAVLGPASSEVSIAVADQVVKYRTPFLVIGSAAKGTTDRVQQDYEKYKYLFKVYHDTDELAGFTMDWIRHLAGERRLKRAALLIENAAWTRPLIAEWKKGLTEAGVEIPVYEYMDKNTKDFSGILSKIKKEKADAVFVASALMDPTAYIRTWAEMEGPMLGGIIGMFPVLWKNTEGKCAGAMSMAYPGFGLTSGDIAFKDRYVEKYQKMPEYTSPYSYEAMYILKAAIEKCRSVEPDALVEALEQTDYDGIMGKWSFIKESHHAKFGPGYRQFLIIQWQSPGTLCVIWPEAYKTCEPVLPAWYP